MKGRSFGIARDNLPRKRYLDSVHSFAVRLAWTDD